MENLNEKLVSAAGYGNTDEVLSCLQRGADINYKDSYGLTALHLAAVRGHDRIVGILVEGGGDINVQSRGDWTALHYAARGGHDRSARSWWREEGTLMSRIDGRISLQGSTPLHWAVKKEGWHGADVIKRMERTAAVLVQSGSDMTLKDNKGKTPLDYCTQDLKGTLEKLAKSTEKKLQAAFPQITDTKEFQQLLSKGFYFSYNNRVYLAGACNVGKSTLASLLIGEAISKKWISTDGLKIYFGKNGIHLKKKEMIAISKALQNSSILANVLLGQPSLDQTQEGDRKKGVLNALKSIFKRTPSKSDPKAMPSEMSTTSKAASKETSDKSFQRSKVMTQKVSVDDVGHHQHSMKSKKQSHTGIHKNLTEEIKSGKYKVQIAPSDLVDFGGQKAFDLTHQLFIQQKGAFVLLIDGRKNLDDVLSEYPDGQMTSRNILLHWVNSILTYCSADNDDIYPLIVFALTHKDQLSKEQQRKKSKDISRQLTDMFSTHEYCDRIRFQQLFLINATDKEDSGVKSLKEFLVSVAFKQKSWGEKMPMAWVPLELQIAEMRSNDIFIISFDELFAINRSNDDLSVPDHQFRHFLRCQHSLGKLMHFDIHTLDKYVIVQPTAMVDILRSFITDKIFWPEESSLHDILNTASSSGIMKKCDLFKLWSQDKFKNYVPTDDIKEYITHVLVHLDILVPPKRFHNPEESLTNTFILPCLVRQSISSSQLPDNLDNDKTIFLSYRLLKSAIPNALAYKLIGAVLNIWPLKRDDGRMSLYDKAAVLEIDQYNELYLTFRENRIEVALSNTKQRYKIFPDIASVIQECLTLTMIKVMEFYSTSFGQQTSSTDVAKLFVVEVGEKCDNKICYIPLSEVQDKSSWTCNHQHEHSTQYPKYWAFDQKQEMCAHDCTGLDEKAFQDVPEDRHLIRLAKLIAQHDFYDLIIHLGLTKAEWDGIKYNYDTRRYNMLTQHFVGLCEWREKKQARAILPTFQDLAKALSDIKYSNHFLCQIFREKFTEVFAMDNPGLKETPDDSVLQELSRSIGHRTLHLGVELGIDMISIEETQHNFSKDMFAQTYDILIKWKRSRKAQPTVRSLMLALQYVDPRGFHFLREQYDL